MSTQLEKKFKDKEQVAKMVDNILKPYAKSTLGRKELAEVFGCHYSRVPAILERRKIPISRNGGKVWSHIKIHKAVLREALISDYLVEEENYEAPSSNWFKRYSL